MPADFTLIQLFLFRQGTRKVEIMNDLAKDMTDDDLRKFADYFAKLPPPKAVRRCGRSGDRGARAGGHRARTTATPATTRISPAASRCRGSRAQREDYLLKALRDYKSGQRPGYDATMDEVIRARERRRHRGPCPLSGTIALKQTSGCCVNRRRHCASTRKSVKLHCCLKGGRAHFKEKDHGLDDTDTRRNLHRARDQRLSAGRVLIADFALLPRRPSHLRRPFHFVAAPVLPTCFSAVVCGFAHTVRKAGLPRSRNC